MSALTPVVLEDAFVDHPGRLMALVGSWLENHDPERDRKSVV